MSISKMNNNYKMIALQLLDANKSEEWAEFKNDCYSYLSGAYPNINMKTAYEIVKIAAREKFEIKEE